MNIKCIYLRDILKNYIKKAKKLNILLCDSVSKRLITGPAIGLLPPIGVRLLKFFGRANLQTPYNATRYWSPILVGGIILTL